MADNIFCPLEDAPNCEGDIFIEIMRHLFGDNLINTFIENRQGGILNASNDIDTVLNLGLSWVGTCALVAVLVVIAINLFRYMLDSANDGRTYSLTPQGGHFMGTYFRPIFSLVMLSPIKAGFPLIVSIVLLVALGANSATNVVYEKFANLRMQVSGISNQKLDKDKIVLAGNDVFGAMMAGATHGYCGRIFEESANKDTSKLLAVARTKGFSATSTELMISYEDSAFPDFIKGSPLCGTYSTTIYDNLGDYLSTQSQSLYSDNNLKEGSNSKILDIAPATSKGGKYAKIYQSFNEIVNAQKEVNFIIHQHRVAYATNAYLYGFGQAYGNGSQAFNQQPEARGFIFGLINKGKSLISGNETAQSVLQKVKINGSSKQINTSNLNGGEGLTTDLEDEQYSEKVDNLLANIYKQSYETFNPALAKDIQNAYQAKGLETLINKNSAVIKKSLISNGWLSAGIAQSMLRNLNRATIRTSEPVYKTTTGHGIKISGDKKLSNETDAYVTKYDSAIARIATSTTSLFNNSQIPANAVAITLEGSSNLDGDSFFDRIFNGITGLLQGNLTDLSASGVRVVLLDDEKQGNSRYPNILYNIQDFGDNLSSTILALQTGVIGFITVGSVAASGANAFPGLGDIGSPLNQSLLSLTPLLFELLNELNGLAKFMAVMIPAMPYVFLALAGVGWFIQILQTAFGMPLWLVMHALPDKTFIGSQAQGYVTLLSLFFRPILIITAFFLCFELYDPIMYHLIELLLGLYGVLANQTSTNTFSGVLMFLANTKFWLYLLCTTLFVATYTIFSLAQELGDAVLNWVGTNLLHGFGNQDHSKMVANLGGRFQSGSRVQMPKETKQKPQNPNNPPPNPNSPPNFTPNTQQSVTRVNINSPSTGGNTNRYGNGGGTLTNNRP